jgi:glutamate dehydrogenase/leucine dehydrogenase
VLDALPVSQPASTASVASFDREHRDHEHLEIACDSRAGMIGVIAVHSSALGPALGGIRRAAYPSLQAAVTDALRLSRAMTLKNSLAGLPLGGGKSVIVDAGGVIQVGGEHLGWTTAEIEATLQRSIDLAGSILKQAVASGTDPLERALDLAGQRLRESTQACETCPQSR